MKKAIILLSAVVAGFAGAGFADNGYWIPAVGCIGWNIFLLWANTKPRAVTRSHETQEHTPAKPLYSYSNILNGWRQSFDERWRA